MAIPSLLDVRFNDNQFTGGLADEIPVNSQLLFFIATNNHFDGPIPSSFGNAQDLQLLFLNENNFIDSIPAPLGTLDDLIQLQLANNQLSGCYPESLLNLCPPREIVVNFSGNTGLPAEGDFSQYCAGMIDSCGNTIHLNLLEKRNVQNEVQEKGYLFIHPNPFYKRTVIDYRLTDQTVEAYLTITDQNGSIIKNIDLDQIQHGQFFLNAKELPTGIYRCSLIIDKEVVETKQMVLTN